MMMMVNYIADDKINPALGEGFVEKVLVQLLTLQVVECSSHGKHLLYIPTLIDHLFEIGVMTPIGG